MYEDPPAGQIPVLQAQATAHHSLAQLNAQLNAQLSTAHCRCRDPLFAETWIHSGKTVKSPQPGSRNQGDGPVCICITGPRGRPHGPKDLSQLSNRCPQAWQKRDPVLRASRRTLFSSTSLQVVLLRLVFYRRRDWSWPATRKLRNTEQCTASRSGVGFC